MSSAPRAVAFSRLRGMSRRAEAGELDEPGEVSVTNWSLRWLSYNAFVPKLFPRARRHALVRYEDLAVAPRDRLRELLASADLAVPEDALGFIRDDHVELRPNHMVYGNRMRFTAGELVVRLDEEWKQRIRPSDRRLTTSLTWPLLRRYGYPTRPGPAASSSISSAPSRAIRANFSSGRSKTSVKPSTST